jgi:hypothetical protein
MKCKPKRGWKKALAASIVASALVHLYFILRIPYSDILDGIQRVNLNKPHQISSLTPPSSVAASNHEAGKNDSVLSIIDGKTSVSTKGFTDIKAEVPLKNQQENNGFLKKITQSMAVIGVPDEARQKGMKAVAVTKNPQDAPYGLSRDEIFAHFVLPSLDWKKKTGPNDKKIVYDLSEKARAEGRIGPFIVDSKRIFKSLMSYNGTRLEEIVEQNPKVLSEAKFFHSLTTTPRNTLRK